MRRTIASIAAAALMFGVTAVAVSAVTADDVAAQETTDDNTITTPGVTTDDAATDLRPGDGFRRGGHHGPKGLDAAAETLGLTLEEVQAELQAGKTLADVASDQGVSVDVLVAALVADATADIQAKVDAGDLTADRAATITDGLTDRVTAMVNGERPAKDDGDGFGRRGPKDHAPGKHLDVAATALGLTQDEVVAELRAGKTLAEVASDQGVSVDVLVAALVADATADIQAKVDAGDLTADRAATITDGLTDRVTAMVNGERPAKGDGFGRRGHHGPGDGFGGDATIEDVSISA